MQAHQAQGGVDAWGPPAHIRHHKGGGHGKDRTALRQTHPSTTQVLFGAGRKLHIFHRLFNEKGELSATGEHMLIHVDLATRAACEPSEAVLRKMNDYAPAHAQMPLPDGAGRGVGQRR